MADALASLWQALKRRPAMAAEAATVRRRALDIIEALTRDDKLVEETRRRS
jgi:thioredoxin-like negative regulator of GroEL